MFESPCLAILGHLGTTWPHLGLFSQPSCHPTSPLEASVADRRDPRTYLASFAKPLTCLKHCCLRWFRTVSHVPSSQHVTLNLALHNPKIQPKSRLKHPKIVPRSLKTAQGGPEMAPKTCANQRVNPVIICVGALVWPAGAILAPLGPILAHVCNEVVIQFRLWTPPNPI